MPRSAFLVLCLYLYVRFYSVGHACMPLPRAAVSGLPSAVCPALSVVGLISPDHACKLLPKYYWLDRYSECVRLRLEKKIDWLPTGTEPENLINRCAFSFYIILYCVHKILGETPVNFMGTTAVGVRAPLAPPLPPSLVTDMTVDYSSSLPACFKYYRPITSHKHDEQYKNSRKSAAIYSQCIRAGILHDVTKGVASSSQFSS